MNESVRGIDLSAFSIDELNELAQKAVKEAERKERLRVVEFRAEIEAKARELGLSLDEVLQADKGRRGGKVPGKVKFRNPSDPSQTWSGRGKRPRWLAEAIDQGAQLDDFAVG